MDEQVARKAYDSFIRKAEADERILGAVFGGGRSKGISTKNSDYDVVLVTTDESLESVKKDYPSSEYIDSLPHSISEFREHARVGTSTEYDKYTFTHAKAIFDKTGEIQPLIDEKGTLKPEEAEKLKRDSLDGYLNSLYRSLKNHRDGNMLAAHLDACESVSCILTFLFAIEGRVRPYNKFLQWELKKYPLKLSIPSEKFLEMLESMICTANIETQKETHHLINKLAAQHRCQDILDSWKGHYFG